MTDERDDDFEHALRNQIAIVIGYCEILLDEAPADSPMHADLLEMLKAATTAMEMLRSEDSPA